MSQSVGRNLNMLLESEGLKLRRLKSLATYGLVSG